MGVPKAADGDGSTTQPASQVEADEFGLPTRRYPSPAVQDEVQKPPKQQEAKPEQPASKETRREDKAGKSDSDSDDGTFEDAPTEPLPVSSTTSPSKKQELAPAPETPKLSSTGDDGDGAKTPVADKPAPHAEHRETVSETPVATVVASDSKEETKPPADKSEDAKIAPKGHNRDMSVASKASVTSGTGGAGISEFSHQQVSAAEDAHKEEQDDGWQTMPAFAPYDMYDDDNKLIAREMEEVEEKDAYQGLGGAGKGYTRVLMDEDAESATSMDENTQYLFKEANGTSMTEDDGRDAVAQMQATKDLLTEGQRVAYVGVVRLDIAKLEKDAETLEVTRKTKKEINTAAEAEKMWGQKMMLRLYAHMEISEAEQIMIEQLAEHGVVPTDLTPALHANSRVVNPMAAERSTDADEELSGSKNASPRTPATPATPKAPGTPRSGSSVEDEDEMPAEMPPPYESLEHGEVPDAQMPSQLPTTEKIDIDLRWTVLCDLFLLLIADSVYDARSRVLLERVGESLDIPWIDICRFEKRVTDALEMQQAAEKENWNEDEHMESRAKLAKKRRYMMMGLATVGGGLVIGLSAGLLAPVIGAGLAAGFTTIGVTGTSSFLAGAGGAAIITSSAAASGSFIGVRAANRRTGAVKTFEYRPLHNNKRVNLVVTVSGWLTGKVDDVRLPFSTVDPIMGDLYSVLWEPEMLRSMGDTINILATEALTQGLQQILGSTILVSLMAALQLPIVLTKLSYLIDNPWAVSLDRATAAGLILADSLMDRSLGTRPITLVGYSLGSRVIFSCLKELAKRGAYGLVQNVYMFGSPIVVKKDEFLRARTVVAGRFVNGYNRNDWILGYLFRLTNGGIRSVAGLAPIDGSFIENIDVTEEVPGHMQYRTAMPTLLMKCGWVVESEEFTEIEDPDPEKHEERQRELINEIEEARKELEREGKANSRKTSGFGIFSRRKKAEKQEWEVYDDATGKAGAAGAAGAAVGGSGRTEDKDGNNHGVLFDIDAIRAELAREAPGNEADVDMALQIKEIESTLPPMKLDIPPSEPSTQPSPVTPTPTMLAAGSPSPFRGSKSAEALPSASASRGEDDSEIQMTFDTSFDDSSYYPSETGTAMGAASAVPVDGKGEKERPGIGSSQTLPNMTLADPWGDPDDEDFGKEKEISMTFA